VAKIYRRACFEEIGGLVEEAMWDGIDGDRCGMLGWKAISDPDPTLAIRQLRPMDSSHRSVSHDRLRWGRGQYFLGTHPLNACGIAAYRMFERPWVLGGLCILAGYLDSWFRRRPRYVDGAFLRYSHRWQLLELTERLVARHNAPISQTTETTATELPSRPSLRTRFGWRPRGATGGPHAHSQAGSRAKARNRHLPS
jgi:hypothetical protein